MRPATHWARNILLIVVLLNGSGICAQTNTGELRIKITDPSGLGLKAKVEISSSANEYRSTLTTDDSGNAIAKNLPHGVYRIFSWAAKFISLIFLPCGCSSTQKILTIG